LQSLGEEVAKVKKTSGVTGERNIRSTGGTKRKSVSKKGATTVGKSAIGSRSTKKGGRKSVRPAKGPMRKSAARSQKKKGRLVTGQGRRPVSNAPVVTVAIKELDPLRKCGPNTTVQFLYRVDESVDGRKTAHLVFFDRHGWYCEHGRTCPAVGYAKKHNGRIARVS
jgi:hypothetical protein